MAAASRQAANALLADKGQLGARMQVIVISSEGELQSLKTSANGRLLVLEAAVSWCRPCKGLQVGANTDVNLAANPASAPLPFLLAVIG